MNQPPDNQKPDARPNIFAPVAHMRGLSGPILYGMDNESIPGKTICHFVRMETQVFDNDANVPTFVELNAKADPRLASLADSFTAPATEVIQGAFKVLSPVMEALSDVLRMGIAVGAPKQRLKWAQALAMAIAFTTPPPAAPKNNDHG